MNLIRCRWPMLLVLVLLLPVLVAAAESDYSVPVPVPDDFGLGERLALIDWLRERRIAVPENAELPALRRLYLAATTAAKPVDPGDAQRREEEEKLRLQLWRQFSVNAAPAASLEDLRRQLQDLQARRTAADDQAQNRVRREPTGDQQPANPEQHQPARPSPPPREVGIEVLPPPQEPRKRPHPIDHLFAEHASIGDPTTQSDGFVLRDASTLMLGRQFPVDGVWTPAEVERYAKIAVIIERLSNSRDGLALATTFAGRMSLLGPEPDGEQAVGLRRRLIERAVRHMGEPLPESPIFDQIKQTWGAVHAALALGEDQGASQHWLLVADRQWAGALIPDLLTALEHHIAVSGPAGNYVLGSIAAWCAASAPPELAPRLLKLADQIKDPLTRVHFLEACPVGERSTLQAQALAALDDQSLEGIRSSGRSLHDAQTIDALVQRLVQKPTFDQNWIRTLTSWPMSPATCARIIEAGMQVAPTLSQSTPDPRAAWLVAATQNRAVRGCLSVAQRTALETARAVATGPGELLLNKLRISEEPDHQQRVALIGQWLQVVAKDPAKERWRNSVASDLVKGLWLEQGRLSEDVLTVLKSDHFMRHPGCERYTKRILARHGIGVDLSAAPADLPPLQAELANNFDPLESPKKLTAYLTSSTTITTKELADIVRVLPNGNGQAWVPVVLQEFDQWWNGTTSIRPADRAAAAVSIGLWAATSGANEWAMIWARRADAASLRSGDGGNYKDGSLIFAVAKPDHVRSRIWLAEQKRIRSPYLPLITWMMEDRTRPLPAEIQELSHAWLQILDQLVPSGRSGVATVAPLLDVRLAFSVPNDGFGLIWSFLLSRLDP